MRASPGWGIALIAIAASCFATMDTSTRFAGAAVPVLLILWTRYLTQAVLMALWQAARHGRAGFATAHPRFQALRGALLLATSACSFYGVQFMPVPEFTAINMVTPVLVTLLAAVWLHEPVSRLRWVLVAGCFAGALIVIRPGSGLFGWAAAFPLGGALTYAAFQVLTRHLSAAESPTATHFYTGLTGTLLLTPLLPLAGVDPLVLLGAAEPRTLAVLGFIALLGTGGHLLLIFALGLAPAATLMPFMYLQIAVATAAGWVVFRQLPDGWAWVGMAVIATCGAWTAALNLRQQRRDETAAVRATGPARVAVRRGSPWEVFLAFLKLGLTSFGGPVAHLGYFRAEFVQRRAWIDDSSYADLVALCQFLPGPASSQVGMALGLGRAGWWGCLAAWVGFTLPSALVLIAFAYGIAAQQALTTSGWLSGLKVVAVAIVAQAVWGMAKSLCPDRRRAGFAVVAALLALAVPSASAQAAVIVGCGVSGRYLLSVGPAGTSHPIDFGVPRRTAWAALGLFALLLVGAPLWAAWSESPTAALLAGFYRSGALVFGGGHVVLPLLQSVVVPSAVVSNADFLAGYGAAQAVPGPLFTFAAYLGAVAKGPLHGWAGGLALLLAIFLPAFLLVVGALPFWESLRRRPRVQSTLAGINAGVVGLLGAALYDPVWTSAIAGKAEFGLALAAFGLLLFARVSPAIVVLLAAIGGGLLLP